MRNSIVLCFLLVCLNGLAQQPCSLQDLLKQPGYWMAAKPNQVYRIAPADLARQRTIVNNVIQPVQQKYSPKGADIEYRSAHMDESRLPKHIKAGNYYTMDFTIIKHDCPYDRKKIMQKLSGAWDINVLRIHVNDFAFVFGQSFFVPDKPNQENPMTDAYALVSKLPVNEKGVWYWENGGGRNNAKEHYWLIAQDGNLPFYYVSQKEFTENLKEYYLKKIKESESNYATQMKITEETFQRLKSINAAEAAKYKEQTEAHNKKMLETEKQQYSKNIVITDKILQTTDAAKLKEPAIIDHISGSFQFTGFVNPNHEYASWVIKPNPAYFDPKLPKSSPQFMAVYCFIQDESVYKIAQEELIKALDFTSLKNMLGK